MIASLILSALSHAALAEDRDAAGTSTQYQRYHASFVVDDKAAMSETYDTAIKALKVDAVKHFKETEIFWRTKKLPQAWEDLKAQVVSHWPRSDSHP